MEWFAANLLRLRNRQCQTQEELAEAIGFTSRYIRRLETGEVDVGLKTLAKFAHYFGVPLAWLLRPARLVPAKPGRPPGRRPKRPPRVRPSG